MDLKIHIEDNIHFEDEVSLQAISSNRVYSPSQLSALRKAREIITNQSERMELNFVTVTSLTSFIESILNDTLLELIHPMKKLSSDKTHLRIIEYLEKRVHGATFQKYDDILFLLTGKRLRDYTSFDTWECISLLFTFRNQIVHGKHFSYTMTHGFDDTETFELSDTYKTVHEFFIKKGLLTIDEVKTNNFYMLKNEMIDYFTEQVILFFTEFAKQISVEYKLVTYDNMHFIREALGIKEEK